MVLAMTDMNDPAPLREAIARIIDDNKYEAWTVDRANQMADQILAALPTDAVQPVGGVDREAIEGAARIIDPKAWNFYDRHSANARMNAEIAIETAASLRMAHELAALYATAPTAGSGWLPIESAPKDGTAVDLLVNGGRWPDYAWNEKRGAWTKEIGYPTRTSVLTTKPSHYFIAPAAPTVGAE